MSAELLYRFLYSSEGVTFLGALVIFLVVGILGVWLWSRRERKLVHQYEQSRFSLERELERQRFELERQRFLLERKQTSMASTEVTAKESEPTSKPEQQSPPPVVPEGLIEAINSGKCTLFWGGGLSAQAGYPTWRQALAEVIQSTVGRADTSGVSELEQLLNAGRFSLAIELVATRLGRDALISEFNRLWGAPRATTPAITALAKLPFTNAVTSVWDSLIDQAFTHREPQVVTGGSSEGLEPLLSRESFCIVRLWGALNRPDSVLFTPNEYRAVVAGNPTYAKYLASLATSQVHLFIGAGIDTIEEYLSAAPRYPSSRTHYALVPANEGIDAAREVFKERYGVELLVFHPSPGWPEVSTFMNNLARVVTSRAPARPPIDVEAFRLTALKLENIGPFRTLALKFDQNWNLLLGDNGAGKSTILRALALVLCGDDTRALIEGARLLRSKTEKGAIELVVGNDLYRTELTRDSTGAIHVNVGSRVSPLKIGRWLALAFPPLRGVSIADPRGPTAEGSPSPVIDDVLPILVGQTDGRLSSLKQWLVNLDVRSSPGEGVSTEEAARNRQLRDHFFKLFNAFVPGINVKFSNVDRKSWQVNVIANDLEVGIDQLSQGASSILGWAGTLLQRMYEIHGADKEISQAAAVVLIDEIDAHLHPDWQQQIVGTLQEQFPNVQFIATTHSPLIVGELDTKQVYRMRWEDGEVVVKHPTQPDPRHGCNRTADQRDVRPVQDCGQEDARATRKAATTFGW
jgi:putative AbiEii toxin of type IV toxin-antitoxin system/AAA domain-containing protein/SIR2-like protein